MTVNAYGGKDAVEPFLEYGNKGILIWCRSSNPSAREFQDLIVEDDTGRRPLWQSVALKANAWNTRGNVGIVMGATYPEQLAEARKLCPTLPILVPGVGAQEGSLRDCVRAGLTAARDGIMVNASRSIIYAARDADFAMAARAAAAQLRDQIHRYRQDISLPAEA
jgi:orotidine-5'-phosphate decarboxylase